MLVLIKLEIATVVSEVGGISRTSLAMAESLDIPLPEITAEEFERSWTRFELVAAAKAWSADKQLAVVPTLLPRGKLLDYYVELEAAETGDLPTLKGALSQRAGLKKDSLVPTHRHVEDTGGP